MPFLESVIQFVVVLAVAVMCGYGVVTLLLPKEYDEHRFILMPPIGYAAFSWASFIFSGSTNVVGQTAVLLVFGASLVLGLVVFATRPSMRGELTAARRGAASILVLTWPMLAVILWPTFFVGPQTFLGSVNPDTFASFFDLSFLRHSTPTTFLTANLDTYSPFGSQMGSMTHSGRFNSELFILLLDSLLRLEQRTVLVLSVTLFVYCLPLSTFFAAKVAFGLNKRAATTAAWFTGVSGCISMSYVYFFVGQNSGLGIFPAVITFGYILVTNYSWRVLLMTAILGNSLFLMYGGMLPYAVAPVGGVVLFELLRGRVKVFGGGAAKAVAVVALMLLFNVGTGDYISRVIFGWSHLAHNTGQTNFFLDFLTEHCVPIFLGLANYPMTTSYLLELVEGPLTDGVVLCVVVLSLITLLGLASACVEWVRRAPDKRHSAMFVASVMILIGNWIFFSFFRQYAYAVFKLCAWHQMLLAVMVAVLLDYLRTWRERAGGSLRTISSVVFVLVTGMIFGANVMVSTRYSVFSLGRDTNNGYIVNMFEMSGNTAYAATERIPETLVPEGSSIGLSFWDSVPNAWLSYYLRHAKISYLGHELMPGDDENLPDVTSRRVSDYFGTVTTDQPSYFHGVTDDFYLTWTEESLNQDIVSRGMLPEPLWSEGTLQLISAGAAPNFIYTGRGWYRLEFRRTWWDFWWPKNYRWTAEGGEVYMLRPSHKGEPYRVSFLAIVGYGMDADWRTVELFANGKKFDEVVVDMSGRVVSKPFVPESDVVRIVIKIKEPTHTLERALPLWNREVPSEYRRLNMAVAEIAVLPPSSPVMTEPSPSEILGNDIFTRSIGFNGINLNRWAKSGASITVNPPVGASSMTLDLFIPDAEGYEFPYSVRVKSELGETTESVNQPGPVRVAVQLNGELQRPLEVVIEGSSEFTPMKSDHGKQMVYSLRINGVEFQ
jgi:hypothetical protein